MSVFKVPWAEAAVRPQGGGGWHRVRDDGQLAQVVCFPSALHVRHQEALATDDLGHFRQHGL